jgi:Protein SCAI
MDEVGGTSSVAMESFGDSAHVASTDGKEKMKNPIEEYRYYLDKSQQLFAGLRELPHTGRNWQPYFQRTFEVYTRLWKHQQQHRQILEREFGLKRFEIGELASKIGQLYYHYYLRTSETNYLQESFTFYEAIHHRQYFKDVLETKHANLMIKKLRYYARFIVVCLLLNRYDMIKKLMDELTIFVGEYQHTYKPNDASEWNTVLSEIETFMEVLLF